VAIHLPEYFKKFLRWIEVDRAIGYSVAGKIWQLFAGPITLLLIASHLSPEVQGFYYTFISLVALQSFVELGLVVVITQFSSHEWSDLDLDAEGNITGKEEALSRLVSLGRLVFKWYACLAGIFILTVGGGGYWFLSLGSTTGVNWKIPWVFYIILSGLELWVMPFISLLEGCNQVTSISLIRLVQTITKSLILWIILLIGGDLWIAVGIAGITLLVELIMLFTRYRNFFKPFLSLSITKKISWNKEIWPMQWRLGIGAVGGYLVHSIYTPVMFHYHDAATAGKMGMTIQLTGVVETLAMVWVSTKVPRFGMLIAKKNWVELDRLFFRSAINSVIVAIICSALLFGAVYGLNIIGHSLAQRMLSPTAFSVLLLANIFLQVVYCNLYYLRAHKKEPLLKLNIIYTLTNGLLVWFLGSQYGPMGACVAYLLTMVLIFFPFSTLIFIRCRKEWHST